MLISPPFLTARGANQSENDWIDACIAGGVIGQGGFPVSSSFGWHGGLHLNAPMNGNVAEQVRAIADGTVVYCRKPVARPSDPATTHAQMYRGQWTDNGVVIIRHDTEIGDGENGKVRFFSIHMHLCLIEDTVVQGRTIYRKAAIGDAGNIYGAQNQIHFEIVCDNANLRNLTGRLTGDLPLAADGRTDAIYGQIYFHVPTGAQVFAQKPLSNHAAAMHQPPTPRGQPKPAEVAIAVAYTTTEALIVSLRYAGGQGAAANRGDAYLSTYQLPTNTVGGTLGIQIGEALNENEAEYDLYTTAKKISESYPATGRPAPSAVYEMLRFGRIIGPDALAPATVPHWRQVRYPGGQGWVNLNAANIHKFSDADFAHWDGWKLVEDDINTDCRCDSNKIKNLLRTAAGEELTEAQLRARAATPANVVKLKKTICKFPTEWDASTIDTKWGWLKTTEVNKLSDEDFEVLRTHITAMAFWQDASALLVGPAVGTTSPTPLPAAHWHFDPREFIRHFRRCGWLSEREMLRCIPLQYQTNKSNRDTPIISSTVATRDARDRLALRSQSVFMKMCRKYGIKQIRLAHFLAQIYQETGVLNWPQELATGSEYEGRTDLGNTHTGDGIRFKGRGLIQTTGRTNYEKYSTYRGKIGNQSYTIEPNNLLLATQPYEVSDTAGLYWVSRNTGSGAINISRVADPGVADAQVKSTTRNVNGAEDAKWTGLVARRSHLKVTAYILLDEIRVLNPEKVRTDV